MLRGQGLKGASEDDMEAVLDRVMMLFPIPAGKGRFREVLQAAPGQAPAVRPHCAPPPTASGDI